MKYKNIKTGAVVDSLSVVRGENWEEIRPSANISTLTKKELYEQLDRRGIKYSKTDDKQELLNLLRK